MTRVTDRLTYALHQARRQGNQVGAVYLTRDHTDQLLAELGQKRDGRCTKRPAIDRFDRAPVYPDRDISMVTYADQAGEGGFVLL